MILLPVLLAVCACFLEPALLRRRRFVASSRRAPATGAEGTKPGLRRAEPAAGIAYVDDDLTLERFSADGIERLERYLERQAAFSAWCARNGRREAAR